jgi:hypothetical protein
MLKPIAAASVAAMLVGSLIPVAAETMSIVKDSKASASTEKPIEATSATRAVSSTPSVSPMNSIAAPMNSTIAPMSSQSPKTTAADSTAAPAAQLTTPADPSATPTTPTTPDSTTTPTTPSTPDSTTTPTTPTTPGSTTTPTTPGSTTTPTTPDSTTTPTTPTTPDSTTTPGSTTPATPDSTPTPAPSTPTPSTAPSGGQSAAPSDQPAASTMVLDKETITGVKEVTLPTTPKRAAYFTLPINVQVVKEASITTDTPITDKLAKDLPSWSSAVRACLQDKPSFVRVVDNQQVPFMLSGGEGKIKLNANDRPVCAASL